MAEATISLTSEEAAVAAEPWARVRSIISEITSGCSQIMQRIMDSRRPPKTRQRHSTCSDTLCLDEHLELNRIIYPIIIERVNAFLMGVSAVVFYNLYIKNVNHYLVIYSIFAILISLYDNSIFFLPKKLSMFYFNFTTFLFQFFDISGNNILYFQWSGYRCKFCNLNYGMKVEITINFSYYHFNHYRI